ncbi:hypothetical protein HDA30_000651 [Micrococcus cohnii]|uniref:Uncharacterized protein n=1 Tax=Micrococcus cohnii TaxID=993416 RepID=A0A7W7GN06_9MICC|nr:hypothetical protein [Micrococcus cohnii]MBB4735143.1 hypothetical protein [Micrococcus cohnii]
MGVLTQSLAVDCAPDGTPARLEWNGRQYTIVARPLRWFQRRRWWAEEMRAAKGAGVGLVDHEVWRLQVRLARAGHGAPVQTIDLVHHRDSGRWRLDQVHGHVREAAPTRQSVGAAA